ncbi:MAG: 50S ribosomal protein L33 [Dehalococcoidia bacterium]|nr:50S ribosomal protein L33 [Dehalococcoidia bacterium]
MAKKGEAREVIWLACDDCKSRNYHTEKNKKNDPERLGLNKFCRKCRSYKSHKEVK